MLQLMRKAAPLLLPLLLRRSLMRFAINRINSRNSSSMTALVFPDQSQSQSDARHEMLKPALFENLDTSDTQGLLVASRTCRSRIKYLLKSGNSEVAVRTLADMNRSGIPINISHYNLLVDYFGRRGELDRMSRVLSAMPRDMAWNVATITSLMTSYAAHGNWRRAKKVFKLHCTNMRESQGVSSPWKIIKPDVVLFDAMIHIAAQSGNSQCVAEWYQLMQEFGFSPSHKTLYNRILGYLGLGTRPFSGVPDSRDVARAMTVLDELETMRCHLMKDEQWNVHPEEAVKWSSPYLPLMRAHGSLNHPYIIKDLFDRCCRWYVSGRPPRIVDQVFMESLIVAGDLESARSHLNSLKWRSVESITPDMLALFLENAVDSDEEKTYLQLLQNVNVSNFQPKANASVVIGRLKRNNLAGADDWFNSRLCVPNGVVEHDAIRILKALQSMKCTAKTVSNLALSWFDKLSALDPTLRKSTPMWTALLQVLSLNPPKELVGYLSDMQIAKAAPNDITFLVILHHYALRNDIDNVDLVRARMTESGIPINHLHYTTIMQMFLRLKMWDKVDATWDSVLNSVISVQPGHTNPQTSTKQWAFPEAATCVYLDSLGFRGDIKTLKTTFEMIRRSPKSLSKVDRGEAHFIPENACNSYVEALLRCGSVDEACRFVLDEMGTGIFRHSPPSPKTFRTVVGMIDVKDDEEKVNGFVNEFKKRWPKIFIYC